MDPNEPPEEISDLIKNFCDLLREYVYSGMQMIDRVAKMRSLIRSVSIIQDTDSCIISLDGWYRKVRDMCIGIPMAIKNEIVDAVSMIEGEPEITPTTISEYDFVTDEIIERDRLIDPMVIIPQDGLRYSIINILSYCVGKLCNEYVSGYCDNCNSNVEGRECLVSLKNEFLFKKVLCTTEKKHYASIMELKEGNVVPKSKSLDIKGMDAFVKSSSNPETQKRLKEVLYKDILASETIDRVQVLRDLKLIELDIIKSIKSGEKKFFKPVKVKSMSAYPDPMRIQGITSSYAYNALHEPGTEAIDLNSRNAVDIAKVDINLKNVDKIKETHPYVYEKAVQLLNTKEYSGHIKAIAIPISEQVPDWILPFIEYQEVLSDNISGFPIESIGLYRGNGNNNYTNIIHF